MSPRTRRSPKSTGCLSRCSRIPDKAVSKQYGVLKTYMGVMEMARRDTFLIDPQRRIAKHYESVEPEGHSAVVLADIKALKAGKKTG